jgi:hypothetical protein
MPIWHIPFALSGQLFSAVAIPGGSGQRSAGSSLTFSPKLPCPYELPWFVSTGAVGTLSCAVTSDGPQLTVEVTLGQLGVDLLSVEGEAFPGAVSLAAGHSVTWSG